MSEEKTYYGKDCPPGKVQVEFVGVSPDLRYSDYGWKPSSTAFIEVYVDGQRFRIDVGNIDQADGTTKRGINIIGPLNWNVNKHSLNSVSLLLPVVNEKPPAPARDTGGS